MNTVEYWVSHSRALSITAFLVIFCSSLYFPFLPDNTQRIYFISHASSSLFLSSHFLSPPVSLLILLFCPRGRFASLWACQRQVMRHYVLHAFFMRRTVFYHICIHQYQLFFHLLYSPFAYLLYLFFLAFFIAVVGVCHINCPQCCNLSVPYPNQQRQHYLDIKKYKIKYLSSFFTVFNSLNIKIIYEKNSIL